MPSFQMEYTYGKLIAVGFLDIGQKGLSSVYFIFDPSIQKGAWHFRRTIEISYAQSFPYPLLFRVFCTSNSHRL